MAQLGSCDSTMWTAKPQIFTICPLQKKFAISYCRKQHMPEQGLGEGLPIPEVDVYLIPCFLLSTHTSAVPGVGIQLAAW